MLAGQADRQDGPADLTFCSKWKRWISRAPDHGDRQVWVGGPGRPRTRL